MTIASEITRLQGAKSDIKTSIENKGVTVPSNAKLDTYDTYIDQIDTGGTARAVSEGTIIGTPYRNFTDNHWAYGLGSGYLCEIGNYVFMLGCYGEYHDSSGPSDRYFNGQIGIYYKLKSSTTRSLVSKYLNTWIAEDGIAGNMTMTPTYTSDNNTIHVKVVQTNNSGQSNTQYVKWVIGASSIGDDTLTAGEDLANYKIYNSHTGKINIDGSGEEFLITYNIDAAI